MSFRVARHTAASDRGGEGRGRKVATRARESTRAPLAPSPPLRPVAAFARHAGMRVSSSEAAHPSRMLVFLALRHAVPFPR